MKSAKNLDEPQTFLKPTHPIHTPRNRLAMLNATKSTESLGTETSLTRQQPKYEKQHSAPVAN